MKKSRIVRLLPVFVLISSCEGSGFKGTSKKGEPAKPSKVSQTDKASKASDIVIEVNAAKIENTSPMSSPAAPAGVPKTIASEPLPALVFGGSEEGSYHLGDGKFDPNSGCTTRLLASGSIAGTALEFHFKLTKTTTLNSVKFADLCGVDDSATRPASVLQFKNSSGNVLQSIAFYQKDNATGIHFGPLASLPAGDYMLMVNSGFETPVADLPNGDYDDFLVGRIDIQADAPITRLGIITRGRDGNIIQQRP